MRYEIKRDITGENIELLITAASIVEPQWVDVIKIAFDGGIKTSIGRHLGPPNLNGIEIEFRPRLSKGPIRRVLSDELVVHLRKSVETSHFSPRLHEMTNMQFANSWCDVCGEAGFKIPMLALIWPYHKTHKETIKWERSHSYLESLARDFLNEEEIKTLRADAKAWTLLGSKSGNCKRRLTRAQLLAPLRAALSK